LQKEYGSFEKWLEAHHPKTKEEWVKLFKKTFKFTGGEIVGIFDEHWLSQRLTRRRLSDTTKSTCPKP
jgi:hypothetical protein